MNAGRSGSPRDAAPTPSGPDRPSTGGRRARSRRALLALIAPAAPGDVASGDDLDWDWMIDRALAHKVGALLAARVRESEHWVMLAPAQRDSLEAARAAAARVVDRAEQTIRVLDVALLGHGIPYLVTKGIVLSRLVYPSTDLRSFSDVDIVVRPADVDASVARLDALGYQLGQIRQTLGVRPKGGETLAAARELTRRFYERYDYELPFTAPSGSGLLPIDLHWRIAPPRRLAVESQALWTEERRIALAGAEVSTLGPEATLIHLAIHATTCTVAAFRLLHLSDVAWAVHRAAHDPERVWRLAESWGAARQLGVVLAMTSRLFGTPPSDRSATHAPRATSSSFLIGPMPRALPLRLWKEAVWGVSMGCIGHNLARHAAVRRTRAVWWANRALRRAVSTGRGEDPTRGSSR